MGIKTIIARTTIAAMRTGGGRISCASRLRFLMLTLTTNLSCPVFSRSSWLRRWPVLPTGGRPGSAVALMARSVASAAASKVPRRTRYRSQRRPPPSSSMTAAATSSCGHSPAERSTRPIPLRSSPRHRHWQPSLSGHCRRYQTLASSIPPDRPLGRHEAGAVLCCFSAALS